jgi:suppressor of G2 allele of SKP1
MDQAARGAAALSASKYDEAIKHYTDAITANPNAVPYYIGRSTAYQRSSKYPEALADAENAVIFARKRQRRELVKDAQLRRGIALFFLEQYANAEYVFDLVKKLDEKEKTLGIWNMKVAAKLKDIPEGDERRTVTAKEYPEEVAQVQDNTKEATATLPVHTAPRHVDSIQPTPADKIKHDWYQNNENVTFTLMAKGVPKDKATVEITKDSLSISFPIAGTESQNYDYTLFPFYAEVDPTQSSHRILSTKIEVTLKKSTPGVKWHSLEGDRKVLDSPPFEKRMPNFGYDSGTKELPVLASKTTKTETAPSYPTSSKKGVKDWDKLAKDDLGDDDDLEGDETSRFFKQLYKGAGEEQQRAMMKSYQESGGTVLSTDWSSVGSKFVAPEPPEGMEAKKYSG